MNSRRVSKFFDHVCSIGAQNTPRYGTRRTSTGIVFQTALFLAITFHSSYTHAHYLNLLTSMSTSVSDTYARLFKEERPDIHVSVLNKNTSNAFEEVLRGNPRNFDIFWSSSPEVFTMLQDTDNLYGKNVCNNMVDSAVPFAVSGIGWAQRSGSTLPMPAHWNDLLRPAYKGKIGMPRPSRSGVAHMIVENMLQIRGWNEGWSYLFELSAQLSTLTARSFGVVEGLKNERFDLGLTIDYLAQSSSQELAFRYGQPTLIAPAQIGVLKGSKNVESACAFINYVLSEKGQRALLDPSIARIPINPNTRNTIRGGIPAALREALDLRSPSYDSALSSSRYWAVNSLFDTFVSDSLMARRELWNRLSRIENYVDRERHAEIRVLLTTMPVDERSNLENPRDPTAFRARDLIRQPEEHLERLAEWQRMAERQLLEIDRLIDEVEESLK